MSRSAKARATKALARFARAKRGSAAVEFAMVALPFLVLMFGIIELGIVFMVSTTLEGATDNAARKIRTGEFQTTGGNTKAAFKTLVCNGMSWLSSTCNASLYVDVQTFADFNGLSNAGQANSQTFDGTTCWSAGQAGDVVLVRSYYEWTLFTPLLNAALENRGTGSGKRLMSASTAFRNEPFNDNAKVGAGC